MQNHGIDDDDDDDDSEATGLPKAVRVSDPNFPVVKKKSDLDRQVCRKNQII